MGKTGVGAEFFFLREENGRQRGVLFPVGGKQASVWNIFSRVRQRGFVDGTKRDSGETRLRRFVWDPGADDAVSWTRSCPPAPFGEPLPILTGVPIKVLSDVVGRRQAAPGHSELHEQDGPQQRRPDGGRWHCALAAGSDGTDETSEHPVTDCWGVRTLQWTAFICGHTKP